MVSTEQGVEYAPLFYKRLEKVKDGKLRKVKGDFDKFMSIPTCIKLDIQCWIDNLPSAYKLISHGEPHCNLF